MPLLTLFAVVFRGDNMLKIYKKIFFLVYFFSVILHSLEDTKSAELIVELKEVLRSTSSSSELSQPGPKKRTKAQKLRRYLEKKLHSQKRSESIQMVSVNSSPVSNYLRYLEIFNNLYLDENKVLLELERKMYENFNSLENLNFLFLTTQLRNSATFEKEYELLRLLWRPFIQKTLRERSLGGAFLQDTKAWQGVSTRHFRRETRPIKLEHLPQNLDFNNEVLGKLPDRASVRAEFSRRQSILYEQISLASLSDAEKSFLHFLTKDILGAIKEAPLTHRIFFIELYRMLGAKLTSNERNGPKDLKAKKLVLNTFFLYVVQPLILDYRVEKVVFSKAQIHRFEIKARQELELKALNYTEDEFSAKVLSYMKKAAEERLSMTNFFEPSLTQALMQSFGVSDLEPKTDYELLLAAVQYSMMSALLHVLVLPDSYQ